MRIEVNQAESKESRAENGRKLPLGLPVKRPVLEVDRGKCERPGLDGEKVKDTYAKGYDFTKTLEPVAGIGLALGRQVESIRVGQDELDGVGPRRVGAFAAAREVFTAKRR